MTEILIGDFVIVLMIFFRIIAMITSAPVLGHGTFPMTAKVLLALILAYIIFLTIDKSKIVLDINLVSIAIGAAREILTGLLMGFMLNMVFFGISFAGSLIGFEMGLMMAAVMNPMTETTNNVVGEVIYYVSVMIFLLINGHHYLISAVAASFHVVPIAKFTIVQPVFDLIIKYSFATFTIAVKIAAPMIVSYLLFQVAEAIIARIIPNIQIMMVTQPAKLGLGFVLLTSLAPMYVFLIKNLLQNYESQLSSLINAMSV